MRLKQLVACCLVAVAAVTAGCNKGADKAGNEANSQESSAVETSAESSDVADNDAEENSDTADSAEVTESAEAEGTDSTDAEVSDVAESVDSENSDTADVAVSETAEDSLEIMEKDYTDDIKADVDALTASSKSLQEELAGIDGIEDKYVDIFSVGLTQYEMNMAASWYYKIWDTELNSLWSRFSDMADEQTKEKVLADQRAWISMKDEAVEEALGPSEQNGSMYPLLKYDLLEEMTKTRSYFIANEIAKIKGEEFSLPSAPTTYGTFVDNQGTDSVYSALITHKGWEDDNVAKISIYRMGEVEGTFVENSDGTLAFTSDDESVKGTITINGWDGATFEVTEDNGSSFLHAGDSFDFPFVF